MPQEARLPFRYYRVLNELGSQDGRTADDLLKEAVDAYLAKRGLTDYAPAQQRDKNLTDEEWSRNLTGLLRQFHQSIETDLTPEEIEAEITAAREGIRQERQTSTIGGHSNATRD